MNTVERLSPELCREFPETIFIFGDNVIKRGMAGQACIRNEPNSFGVPTKIYPSMDSKAFFSDRIEEWSIVNDRLLKLTNLREEGKIIVFPKDGLGTGLAQMNEKSPKIFEYMNSYIKIHFS